MTDALTKKRTFIEKRSAKHLLSDAKFGPEREQNHLRNQTR